jgi:hypothetical protein
MLRDESTRAAERASAGVTVEVEVWRDMAHVFHALPLPQARPADDSVVQSSSVMPDGGWKRSRHLWLRRSCTAHGVRRRGRGRASSGLMATNDPVAVVSICRKRAQKFARERAIGESADLETASV